MTSRSAPPAELRDIRLDLTFDYTVQVLLERAP